MSIISKLLQYKDKDKTSITSASVEDAFGVKLNGVVDLHELITYWKDIYCGIPEWVGFSNTSVKESLNVASMIVGDLATKAVSELSLDSHSPKMREFFDTEIKEQIRTQIEYMLAMGAVCVRPYIDYLGEVRLGWYTADRFLPLEWEGKRCVSGIFSETECRQVGNHIYYYTKLECHKWDNGTIDVEVKLFRSDNDSTLGQEVALSEIDYWANLAPSLHLEGAKSPLFCYIRTPFANNKSMGSPIGVSIFKDSTAILEAIDRTWDNLKWEMESATARLFVEADAIPMHMASNGKRVLDINERDMKMFTVLDSSEGKGLIATYAPQIRQSDIVHILKTNMSLLCASMHLDSGAYVYDDSKQMVTATEVSTKEQKTYQTIRDIQMWSVSPSVKAILEAVAEYQRAFGLEQFTTTAYTLDFGDSIIKDESSDKITAQQEVQYGLRSKLSYLMDYRHLSKEDALEEIERLKHEQPTQMQAITEDKSNPRNKEDYSQKVRDSLNPRHEIDDIKSTMKTRDSK